MFWMPAFQLLALAWESVEPLGGGVLLVGVLPLALVPLFASCLLGCKQPSVRLTSVT